MLADNLSRPLLHAQAFADTISAGHGRHGLLACLFRSVSAVSAVRLYVLGCIQYGSYNQNVKCSKLSAQVNSFKFTLGKSSPSTWVGMARMTPKL